MNDLFHPEKRRRHRDGYEDGDYTLHTVNQVEQFINHIDFLGILSRSSALTFGDSEFEQKVKNHPLTNEAILEYFEDLKVLGKKEFKEVLKWRDNIRIAFDLVKKQEESEPIEEEEKELTIEEMIQEQREKLDHRLRKEKKKRRERKAKLLMKMQMGMDTPDDIGIESSMLNPLAPEFEMGEASSSEEEQEQVSEDESAYDSEEERAQKIARLDQQMDEMYESYKQRRINKNPTEKVKMQKEGIKAQFEEWYGIEAEKNIVEMNEEAQEDASDSDSSDEEMDVDEPLSSNTKLFFDNPVFKAVEEPNNLFGEELVLSSKHDKKRKSQMDAFSDDEETKDQFQVIPIKEDEDAVDGNFVNLDSYLINTAQAYTMAQQLLTKSGRRDLIDGAFNRYAFNDPEGLPEWFTNDEGRHNKPSMPVTKEAVDIMRQKSRALDARPIKKVAEAKFRKQMRAQRRIEKSLAKAEGLNQDEDLSQKSRLESIEKLMNKAKKANKNERKKPTLVVAKGFNKGAQGRPKGVKGRYKVIYIHSRWSILE